MNEMTFRDYLKILFRHKWVIVVCVLVVTAAVAIGLKFKTNKYAATVKFLITGQKQAESPYYADLNTAPNTPLTLTQSEIVKSSPVVERALQAILNYKPLADFPTYEKRFASELKRQWIDFRNKQMEKNFIKRGFKPEQIQALRYRSALAELKSNIEVEPIRDTNLFTITVKDYDPVGAAIQANIVSRSYIIFDLEQQLSEMQLKYGDKHLAVSQLKDSIRGMIQKLNGQPLPDTEAIGPASVKIVEQAGIPTQPAERSKKVMLALAVMLGAFLGFGLAFIFEYMDQTARGPMDIEKDLGVRHLGSVIKKPFMTAVLTQDTSARDSYTRSYRQLADQLYMALKDRQSQTVLLASPSDKEKSALTAFNLAIFFADYLSLKVLLVDANLRRPSIAKLLKTRVKFGLAELVAGDADMTRASCAVNANLHVIASNTAASNPITIFERPRMKTLIAEWKQDYDLVIFDAANLGEYKDAYILSDMVDQVVMVLRQGVSRRPLAKYVINALRGRKTNLLGAILKGRAHYIPRFIYERV
jgi:Mrp family chromosome partitioning ATPase